MDSFIIVKCVSLSLVLFLALNSISSVRNIATPAICLHGLSFPHTSTFKLCIFYICRVNFLKNNFLSFLSNLTISAL